MFLLPHPQEWPIANVSGPHLPPSRGRVVYFSTHHLTGESLLHISFLVKVPISKLCCCQGFHVKTRWMQCGVEPSQRESCEMDKAGSPGQQYTRCPLVLRSSCLSKLGLNAAGSLFSMHLHRKYNLFLHACRAKAVHLQCSAVVIQQCKLTLRLDTALIKSKHEFLVEVLVKSSPGIVKAPFPGLSKSVLPPSSFCGRSNRRKDFTLL